LTSAYAAIAAESYPVGARGLEEPHDRSWYENLTTGSRPLPDTIHAEMLDLLPGSLLAEVDEALEARIVVTDRDSIAFRHELVWQAVADSLPQPVARALHRQAGQMLLAHGEDAVAAARHLLAGAHRGDSVALAGLDRAVANAAQSAPTAAAELAIRVLDLTGPTDPGRYARTVAAVSGPAASPPLTHQLGLRTPARQSPR